MLPSRVMRKDTISSRNGIKQMDLKLIYILFSMSNFSL